MESKSILRKRGFVLFDTSYLVPLTNSLDKTHKQAVISLEIIRERSSQIQFIIPQIALFELTVVLQRTGLKDSYIQEIVRNLCLKEEILFINIDGYTISRYISNKYIQLLQPIDPDKSKIYKTNDYLIACIAIEFDALVIASDTQMISTLKNIHIPTFDYRKENFSILKEFIS